MPKRKLIFLDIDGTLTVPLNRVPRSARAVCAASRRAGNLLFICTGRARLQIPPEVLSLGVDGVISSGGARVEVAGELLYSAYFDSGLLSRVVSFLDRRELAYEYECPGRLIAGPYLFAFYERMARRSLRGFFRAAMFKRFWRSFPLEPVAAAGGDWRREVCKVVYMTDAPADLADFKREFGSSCEHFDNSIPGMTGAEVSPKGVHKGAAVALVMEKYAAAREDVFAFGDSDNDRTMLAVAGHGIAMGNATVSLKALACDITAPVNRNGLAKAFRKYGLA